MQQDWHGLDGLYPAARIEELVGLLRTIYLPGVNRRMPQAAGTMADGLVGHLLYVRDYVEQVVRPMLAEGAGAPAADWRFRSGATHLLIRPRRERARARAAAQIAFYSTVKACNPILGIGGFLREAEAIRAAWRTGSKRACWPRSV
jgi:hypothetical protein